MGIGASAGGLEAFTQLLQHLPVDTGMAFVLVQHLDPAHESALTNLLARTTTMPVREVTNNLRIEPNHVYVIPPNAEMALAGGTLRLLPRTQTRGAHRSIDSFLESLAEHCHDQAIGVILSGTASDGTLGLEAIKAEGGITFAQDESAKYDSMPRNAIAAGCVDFVLSPEKIAGELARIASHPYLHHLAPTSPASLPSENSAGQGEAAGPEQLVGLPSGPGLAQSSGEESHYKKILLLLRNHFGVDFSFYKPTTIERRITRRMVLNKSESLEAYAAFLRGNTKELDLLYSDLLINVTSFFRNPEAFEVLKAKVFPRILPAQREEPVRMWVLGCSTGQEAYSLAMVYLEFCENMSRAPQLQIFATDLNEAMLEKARRGLYAKSLLQDVSPERLRHFFVEEDGGYRITKSLREICVFARQNLLSDPPFSRMDLVSCRNLLIYIQSGLQEKILPSLHYALKPEGFLFLGASESIGAFTELFEPVDKKLKIFSRKAGSTPGFRLPVARGYPAGKKETAPDRTLPAGPPGEVNAQREADRLTLARFAPSGVLVNADLQVLQFRGPTAPYLEPPTGKASFDLLKMAHADLLLPLRAAIDQAKKQGQVVRAENLHVGAHTVNLEVMPLKNLRERCYLVFFEEATESKVGRSLPGSPPQPELERTDESHRRTDLARELADTRDYLQSLREQYEATNEELQTSNEEVTSANEELQSINEELETSKEELESTNEELTTVNEEMANRNQELNRLNSDLNNLHVSINTPILLLDRALSIRRFTPQAQKLFNLLATDVGRPLGGIKHNLEFPGLEQFISEVIDTVTVREREVQDKAGHWYVLRVRPYLTLENKIDGAVLLLSDINTLKQHEQEIANARDFAHAIIASVPPMLILNQDLRVQTANESFYQTFHVTPAQTENRLIFELGNGQWNIPALRALLEDILPGNRQVKDYEVTHEFEDIGRRTMLVSARQVDSLQTIVLAIEDITERKQAEQARADLAAIIESSADAVIGKDLNGIIRSWNQGAERLFGYQAEEVIGRPIALLIPIEDQALEVAILERLRRGERIEHYEAIRISRDGRRIDVSLSISPIRDQAGAVIGAAKIARDITKRKRAEEQLRLQLAVLQSTANAIVFTGRDGIIQWVNPALTSLTGYSPAEVIGQNPRLFNSGKQDAAFYKHMWRTILAGQPWHGELINKRKDGSLYPEELTITPVTDAKGQITHFIAIKQDITRRKQAEQALQQAADQRRLALESANLGTWDSNLATGQVFLDDRLRTILGVSTDRMAYEEIIAGMHPEDQARVDGAVKRATSPDSSGGYDIEYRVVWPDRSIHWVLAKGQAYFEGTGPERHAVRFIGTVMDISERKKAEESLRRQLEEITQVYKYAPAALFVLDRDLRFLRANEHLAEMNGKPLDAHLGHTLHEILSAPMIEDLNKVWAPIFEKGEPVLNVEVQGETPKLPGVKRHWVANYFPLKSHTGEVRAMAGAITEITERKKMELELAKAKDELEQRVTERTAKLAETIGELEQFSYALTHDMRAPLRAMQGFGRVLLAQCNDCLREEHKDLIRRIAESADRMDSLITDALQYNKVIRQELELEPIDPAALLRTMIESYPQFQPPQAEVRIEGPIPRVMGNEAGLTQCFSNLLNNAVKFIQPDTLPKVRVWGETRGEYVRLWFEDNGIGIDKRHHDQIFVMFQVLSKSYEGTGIGLALVRKIVERMQGQVGLESEEGQGSRFWLELKRCD